MGQEAERRTSLKTVSKIKQIPGKARKGKGSGAPFILIVAASVPK